MIVKIPLTDKRVGVVEVYSLRKDSWISIPSDFDFDFSGYNRSSVYTSGAIHFVIYYKERPTVIAAFDLAEDKFKTLPPPEFMLNKVDDKFGGRRTYLGQLSGCLCLSNETVSRSIELWVMKEYGVISSWTKILIAKTDLFRVFHPLCYLNNNETILVSGVHQISSLKNNMMFWDSKDEKFKNVKIDCIEYCWSAEDVYVESLVSPNSHIGLTTESIDNFFLFYI
ncbi:hypothetical protein EZV62_006223 [Acer yangbiense]|uniref:F-box associated beta-propeller type 1 domain-containing protein n=1 Tax=Acer yangbiense TaxID=1000413 RepID=A0A5C7IQB8_9ROSI|nr:hypothetical protein EZV62_006223 [Acer yangbiense]